MTASPEAPPVDLNETEAVAFAFERAKLRGAQTTADARDAAKAMSRAALEQIAVSYVYRRVSDELRREAKEHETRATGPRTSTRVSKAGAVTTETILEGIVEGKPFPAELLDTVAPAPQGSLHLRGRLWRDLTLEQLEKVIELTTAHLEGVQASLATMEGARSCFRAIPDATTLGEAWIRM